MRRRSGFTLVEVITALVLTGVVALLVYGALGTAADTQARLAGGGIALRRELAWRAIVTDAVRGVRSPDDYDDPTLVVESRTDGRSRPADRVVLVTSGSMPPLTADADWRVVLAAGPDGVFAEATPLAGSGTPSFVPGPADLVGLDVQVLARGSSVWRDSWPGGGTLPRALRITFWTASGPWGDPFLVALPLGSGP